MTRPSQKTITIGKNTVVPISLSLVAALVIAVWFLALKVSEFTMRIDVLEDTVEKSTGHRWSYLMEREAWEVFARDNPEVKIPNVQEIRSAHQSR